MKPNNIFNYPQYITYQHLKVAYYEEGTGSTLLFLHGLTGSAATWQIAWNVFKPYYHCLAIDLPAHGNTAIDENGSYTIPYFSAIIQYILHKKQIKACTVVAHSMGGQIALNIATQQNNCWKNMILSAPAGLELFTANEQLALTSYNPAIYKNFQYKNVLDYWKENLIKQWYPDWVGNKKGTFPITEQVMAACISGMISYPIYQQLPQIKVPVLLVFGKDDPLIPNKLLHPTLSTEKIAEMGRQQIPNCVLKLYEKAGHYPHVTQASQFNLDMYRFLDHKK